MQYRATILGEIWQPGMGLCATVRLYGADSDEDAAERAYYSEAGDFSSVKDVTVDRLDRCRECGGIKRVTVKRWDYPDSEDIASDCLYPEDI